MKVSYGVNGKAYLDDEPLSDGSHVGTNKHTDLPVHLRWDDEQKVWVEVCIRVFDYPGWDASPVEVEPRPLCTCWEKP